MTEPPCLPGQKVDSCCARSARPLILARGLPTTAPGGPFSFQPRGPRSPPLLQAALPDYRGRGCSGARAHLPARPAPPARPRTGSGSRPGQRPAQARGPPWSPLPPDQPPAPNLPRRRRAPCPPPASRRRQSLAGVPGAARHWPTGRVGRKGAARAAGAGPASASALHAHRWPVRLPVRGVGGARAGLRAPAGPCEARLRGRWVARRGGEGLEPGPGSGLARPGRRGRATGRSRSGRGRGRCSQAACAHQTQGAGATGEGVSAWWEGRRGPPLTRLTWRSLAVGGAQLLSLPLRSGKGPRGALVPRPAGRGCPRGWAGEQGCFSRFGQPHGPSSEVGVERDLAGAHAVGLCAWLTPRQRLPTHDPGDPDEASAGLPVSPHATRLPCVAGLQHGTRTNRELVRGVPEPGLPGGEQALGPAYRQQDVARDSDPPEAAAPPLS